VQDTFIQQHVQQRRVGAGQQSLPGEPRGHQFLDLLGASVRAGGQDRPRVVGGLQQARNQDVLEQPQTPRPGLVRTERAERRRVGQVPQAGLQPGERAPVRAEDLVEPFGQITGGAGQAISVNEAGLPP
jgi:hypothetical protein